MAHLALVIDDDRRRRDAFVLRVRRLYAGLGRITVADATVGPLACVWAHGPRAPVSVHRAGDTFALLLGYGVADDDRWITAADLAECWLGDGPAVGVFDGYHVGVAYDVDRGLAAAVDPFGLFPLHHGSIDADTPIVATTPEAFRCHDGFRETVDREGLAGILLGNGPLDDRPLVAGIRRLQRGHRLSWRRGRRPTSRAVHGFVGTPPPAGESPEDLRRRIDAELIRAIRRHRPANASTSLLLSGGLDSRLVAGCLTDLGAPTRAVILGTPDDFEVLAGTAVADRLGMPRTVVSTDACVEGFPDLARGVVRFGHLSAAPDGNDFGLGLALAGTTDPFFWSGVLLDCAFEPICGNAGCHVATGAWSFDILLSRMNRWGVPLRDLPGLLGRDGSDLVATVVERARSACLAGPGQPVQRALFVRWDQRVRNHIAAALHQTTFVSWPLLPATDRRFYAAVFGLPPVLYADRRLERAVLRARRPDLAAIPLDDNSFQFEPARGPTARRGPLGKLAVSARKRLRRWYWQGLRGFDPRRYQRLFDVDHPRWQAVRRAAEPLRPRLHAMLDAESLDRLLPPPDTRRRRADPVVEGSGTRLLLGLALWCDRPAA